MTRQWRCPRCGQSFPPKAYSCPICKARFDTDYNLVYDKGTTKGHVVDRTWDDVPSGNMGYEEFTGIKTKKKRFWEFWK